MRSLDLVKHAMEEALAVAAAMPEESAIMPSPSEGGLMDATDIHVESFVQPMMGQYHHACAIKSYQEHHT